MRKVPVAPPSKRRRMLAASSDWIATDSPSALRSNVAPASRGRIRRGDERAQVGHHLRDTQPADVLDGIEPVRADVGDRARASAGLRLDAPVVVALLQQPVLQVRAEHEPQVAELAVACLVARLAHHRVPAIGEGDRSVATGIGGPTAQVFRLGRVECQWLLHHHVLARLERPTTEIRVGRVGGADVHDVDRRIGQQLVGRADVVDPEPFRHRRRRAPRSSRPSRPRRRGRCAAPRRRDAGR